MDKTTTSDEKYWLDYLFKTKASEERLPELGDEQLAKLRRILQRG